MVDCPRVVLDTNVVLSALLFRQGRLAPLRRFWQEKSIIAVACLETITELTRILGSKKFKLTDAEISTALAQYLPYVEVHRLTDTLKHAVPQCRDPKDQIFLNLALHAHVDWLVTGDADLLVLHPTQPPLPFGIATPQTLLDTLHTTAKKNPL